MDADVIIDFLTDRPPYAEKAAVLFRTAEQQALDIWTSSLVISNIHYIIRNILGDKKARAVLRELVDVVSIQGVGKQEVTEALASYFKDFEDALQHATALKVKGIDAIITRNIKDYKKSSVAVFTPEEYLKARGIK